MKKFTEYVNVFQGNSVVSSESLSGVASHWAPIKGLSGNTHPGAQLPFGKISACAYSGAYPTGYGNNRLNCGEPVKKLYDKKSVLGISHLHHSGVGAVGFYYNYALTTPFYGKLSSPSLNTLSSENACPGYYSGCFAENEVKFELTADNKSAHHRYIFPKGKGNISVDLSNDGIADDPRASLNSQAGDSFLEILDEHTASASVILQGLTLYFTVYCDSGVISIWEDYIKVKTETLATSGKNKKKFGFLFENTNCISNVVVTISLKSKEKSLSDNLVSRKTEFDDVVLSAESIWNDALSKITVETDDRNKEIFYSNLYHSIVKPSDWSGESIYYSDDDFALDFTTLWDIYKTQLPLLFSLFPDISRKIVATYLNLGKFTGAMPNLFDLCSEFNCEAQQARFLAGYLFSDAYYRNLPGFDWNEILDILVEILFKSEQDFFEKGECSRTTHTLDMAEACCNLANIAKDLKREDIVKILAPHAEKWKAAFDEQGLLKDGYEYYEGNRWNYSFRPMNSMQERIDLAGGTDEFIALLDRFFGFSDAEDKTARFEGFNNETDMETPYAYNFVGRMDRLAEVLAGANRFLFTTGEGGAPGNVDSGGLSACYIWNAIGIFPVSGQNLMLVGMPYFEKSVIKLANTKTFTVVRHGNGNYIKKASLNDTDCKGLKFAVTDMMNGGTLDLYTE